MNTDTHKVPHDLMILVSKKVLLNKIFVDLCMKKTINYIYILSFIFIHELDLKCVTVKYLMLLGSLM